MPKPKSIHALAVLAAGLLVGALACTNDAPTPDTHGAPRRKNPRAEAVHALDGNPVIVRVVGRHQTITVTASPNGPLYTAATNDGRVLVAAATIERLRTEHPEIYRQLEPSMAVEAQDRDGARQAGDRSGGKSHAEAASGAADAPVMLMSADVQ